MTRPGAALIVLGLLQVHCGGADTVDDRDASPPTDSVAQERTDQTLDLIERLSGHWFQGMLYEEAGLGPAFDLNVLPDGRLYLRRDYGVNASLRLLFSATDAGGEVRDLSLLGTATPRDLRAELVQADDGGWRFCAASGCDDYAMDVSFREAYGETYVTLEVTEQGVSTLSWDEGIRYGDLPGGRPQVADADAPIEGLHQLTVEFSWIVPTEEPAQLVAVLARERCQAGCRPTQVGVAAVPAGVTSAELIIDELPADTWYVQVFLDRNANAPLRDGPRAGSGDPAALPDQEVQLQGDVRISLESFNEV